MSYKPFYIAAYEQESGMETYYESFLTPEKAFPILEDAYSWRARVLKRPGFTLLGRLRRIFEGASIGDSGDSPWTFNIYSSLTPAITDEPHAEIEPGSVTIDIDTISFTDQGDGTLTSSTPGNSGVINYATGSVTLTHTSGSGTATTIDFSYYPTLPVMGLRSLDTSAYNEDDVIAFDTKYSYEVVNGEFNELPATTPTTWTGTDSDFFWSTNYWTDSSGNDLFWATNNNMGSTRDPIRYYDDTDWTTFNPLVTSTVRLQQCLMILPYKGRLVCLNTWEGSDINNATNFAQRVRWSQNGTPLPSVDADAWRDDIVGKGGFLDAPTNQQITSCEFIKDVLIVKCERSSWKLIYTGNEVLPFVFQQINTELGCESTFSIVPFDRGVFSVGNYGITTDDSVNVSRIDERIPNTVFDFNNDNQGVKRVYGIRDYGEQLVYWTYPDSATNPIFPNKVLVYNYVNQTWAIFNDSFTCFGYYQRPSDLTWATLPYTSWAAWNQPWDTGQTQSRYPDVIAGNQQGFVEILNQDVDNDPALTIHDILPSVPPSVVQLVSPNHNMQTGQFVKITGIIGSGDPNPNTLNDTIYKVVSVDIDTIELQAWVDGAIQNVTLDVGGEYLGGGVMTPINNINIWTKRFSPFFDAGQQVRLGYVDFFLDRTAEGEVTVNVYNNENGNIPLNQPETNPSVLGENVVLTRPENGIPFQTQQDKIWHRLFTPCLAQNFQIQITMDDEQMFQENISNADFVMHAMTLYLSANARMVQ